MVDVDALGSLCLGLLRLAVGISGAEEEALVGNVVAIKRLVRTRASAFLIVTDKNESYFTVWPDNFRIYTASQSNFSPGNNVARQPSKTVSVNGPE